MSGICYHPLSPSKGDCKDSNYRKLFPVFGLSAYASFSGAEGIATQEQRKSSQRDALIEGPYPQDEASRPGGSQSRR